MGSINKIAVLYGGSSSEREVSIQSGKGVHNAICDLGYESDLIDFINLNNLNCLLYTSPSPRDVEESRMPSSA